MVELSVNYRTPGEIMEVASRVLDEVAPDLRPPLSARATGARPRFVTPAPRELAAAVAAVVEEESGQVRPGTTAVIVAAPMQEALGRSMEAAGVDFVHADRKGLDAAVTLLAVGVAKGLEFDAVVVVEPALIVEEEVQGLRALYVALTRATRRLAVVHARALPASLSGSSISLRAAEGTLPP